jgi:hypothetical protein
MITYYVKVAYDKFPSGGGVRRKRPIVGSKPVAHANADFCRVKLGPLRNRDTKRAL